MIIGQQFNQERDDDKFCRFHLCILKPPIFRQNNC